MFADLLVPEDNNNAAEGSAIGEGALQSCVCAAFTHRGDQERVFEIDAGPTQ